MFARIRKAVTGGLTTGASAFVVAWQDHAISNTEWATILGALVVGFTAVYLTPRNAPPLPPPA